MRRRLLAGMSGLSLCLLLTACGGSDDADPDAGTTPSAGGAAVDVSNYPADCDSVQMIVGYTAGGATDIWARILADAMSTESGADIQVVNAPGAGGTIGINQLLTAPTDGCTIGNVNLPSGLGYLYPNSPATYTKDSFSLVASSGYSPNVIVVADDSPYQTFQDLIDAAKAAPGDLNAASDGAASDDAIAYGYLEEQAGVTVNQVIVDGSADKVAALLGGQVDFFGGSLTGILPQVQAGQFRVLAVYAEDRSAFLPDAPTAVEQGYDILSNNRWSIAMAAGVPEEKRQAMEDLILKVAADPDYVKANADAGIEVVPLTGAELSKEWDAQAEIVSKFSADF